MCLQCVLRESCELALGCMGNQLYACSGRPQLCDYSMLYGQAVVCLRCVADGESIETGKYSKLNTTWYRESFGSKDHVHNFQNSLLFAVV